jgi:hypothetical protein
MMPEIPAPGFLEQMERYIGEMRKALDAAEVLCDGAFCDTCPFRDFDICTVETLRVVLGDHVFPGEPVQECRIPNGNSKQMGVELP